MSGQQFDSMYTQDQPYQEKEAGIKQDEGDESKLPLDTKKAEDSKPKKPVGRFRIQLT